MAKSHNRLWNLLGSKQSGYSSHASLAALGSLCQAKELLAPIHQQVVIDQKTVDYSPTDKLIFVVIGILAGSEALYEINPILRGDKPLLRAFGYQQCADQSTIADTLSACTDANVLQLEQAIGQIFSQQTKLGDYLTDAKAGKTVVVDATFDLN